LEYGCQVKAHIQSGRDAVSEMDRRYRDADFHRCRYVDERHSAADKAADWGVTSRTF